MTEQATKFWAKTKTDGTPGISVKNHMMYVGYVALCIGEIAPPLLELFHLRVEEVGAIAALHDLGKISPGFQRKCEAWLIEHGLLSIARNGVWDTAMEPDHGKVTHAALQKHLSEIGANRKTATFLSSAIGGHHGKMNRPDERGFRPGKSTTEHRSGIDWDKERDKAAKSVTAVFKASLSEISLDDETPALWWLAGLTTVADWIGSDERFFPMERELTEPEAAKEACHAVAEIGCVAPKIVARLSFHDLFDLMPNDMQVKAFGTITAPGVYIIEAPMGSGKTEAALWAAYHLLETEMAQGIYFALPTQVTSNRIHRRMAEFVRRIAPTAVGSRLIHANSWLMEDTPGLSPVATIGMEGLSDARAGRDWFTSAKRALLAPFGVGTVDQALLGVVAVKHFFVRHFALAGKVVIIDEVHSYDLYTGTLIDQLIKIMETLGCTVILLSATLSGKRREKIVPPFRGEEIEVANQPYPLITGRRQQLAFEPVPATPPEPRSVEILFRPLDWAESLAIDIAEKGGCVLWIRNTVDATQKQYRRLQDLVQKRFPLGLLHSRFPFWRREELENEWMERFGKDGKTRCGSMLVSTQVVEQSVDLDADLLITELAPTDMLLQRMGRLWRHQRNSRPLPKPRFVILEETVSLDGFRQMTEKDIVESLGGKAYVYDPYVLLRSLEVWKNRTEIAIPMQIREIIESTYEDRDSEPESWQRLFIDGYGKSLAHKQKALQSSNIWIVALDDEEGVQTRLNEVPTLSLVLCHSLSDTKVEFIDNTVGVLGGKDYRLSTAQSIHRNLVKIPEQNFDRAEANPAFAQYLRGKQSIGIVKKDGIVSAKGLKHDATLRWSTEFGLVIEKVLNKGE